MSKFKVYKEPCKNCLLSKDAIVSPERRSQLIAEITEKQSFFVCHKSTMRNEEVCCKKFYDEMGHNSQLVRIARRLGVVEFVNLPDNDKLPTHREMFK